MKFTKFIPLVFILLVILFIGIVKADTLPRTIITETGTYIIIPNYTTGKTEAIVQTAKGPLSDRQNSYSSRHTTTRTPQNQWSPKEWLYVDQQSGHENTDLCSPRLPKRAQGFVRVLTGKQAGYPQLPLLKMDAPEQVSKLLIFNERSELRRRRFFGKIGVDNDPKECIL